MGILIQLLSRSKKRNQQVAINRLSENLRSVFDMVGIETYTRAFGREEGAILSLAGG